MEHIHAAVEAIDAGFGWRYDDRSFLARTVLHIGLYSLALILAYDLYREVWKGYDHVISHFISKPELPHDIRHSLQMPHSKGSRGRICHRYPGKSPWKHGDRRY